MFKRNWAEGTMKWQLIIYYPILYVDLMESYKIGISIQNVYFHNALCHVSSQCHIERTHENDWESFTPIWAEVAISSVSSVFMKFMGPLKKKRKEKDCSDSISTFTCVGGILFISKQISKQLSQHFNILSIIIK